MLSPMDWFQQWPTEPCYNRCFINRNRIRRHLLIFSCAAPLLALLTYFGIGNESKQTLSEVNATGELKRMLQSVVHVIKDRGR